jgi:uncharacterized protein YcfL
MKYLLLLVLLLTGCVESLQSPLVVRRTILYNDGTCSLGLQTTQDNIVWVRPNTDNCQYKVGDVLK